MLRPVTARLLLGLGKVGSNAGNDIQGRLYLVKFVIIIVIIRKYPRNNNKMTYQTMLR